VHFPKSSRLSAHFGAESITVKPLVLASCSRLSHRLCPRLSAAPSSPPLQDGSPSACSQEPPDCGRATRRSPTHCAGGSPAYCSGAPRPRCTGAPPPHCTGAPPPHFTGAPPSRCTGVSQPRWTGASPTRWTGASPSRWTGAPPPRCTGAPPPRCTDAPPPRYISTPAPRESHTPQRHGNCASCCRPPCHTGGSLWDCPFSPR